MRKVHHVLLLVGLLLPIVGLQATSSAMAKATSALVAFLTPFHITPMTPTVNQVGAPLETTIQATFDTDVNPTTLTNATFVVQSNQRGRLPGAINYNGGARTVTFTPAQPLIHGEQIQVVGTQAVASTISDPLTPYQWSFTAGQQDARCIGGFQEVAALPGVYESSVAWGDYDKDGDLDALLAGFSNGQRSTRIYRNDSIPSQGTFVFTNLNITLPGGSVSWGDYDNDTDLDILITGDAETGSFFTRVYRNNGNQTFTEISTTLLGVRLGDAAWGDYNNDGLLDILLMGDSTLGAITRIYRNDGDDDFSDISAGLTGVKDGSASWGDYDKDGDLDILVTGNSAGGPVTLIYRNDGNNTFTNINAGLLGVKDSRAAWGDYDKDGDLDILLTGNTSAVIQAPTTRIYRNTNGVFADINAGLSGVLDGSVDWGDYDNDGDLDIALSGLDQGENALTRIYRNDNGAFTQFNANVDNVNFSGLDWGDLDGDKDLDLAVTGLTKTSVVTKIYRNFDCPSDVKISKTAAPARVAPGQPITFTITFSNAGPVAATVATVTDLVPQGITNLQVVSSTFGAGIAINDTGVRPGFIWSATNLEVGAGGIITIKGNAGSAAGVVYHNVASIAASKDITLTDNSASADIVVPFHIIQTDPTAPGLVSVPLGAAVKAKFDADVDLSTVDKTTFAVYGNQSGFLSGGTSYDTNQRLYSFTPAQPFMQGEVVNVVGTAEIYSMGEAPLIPYQWQFVAGRTNPRCVGDFANIGALLPAVSSGATAWGDYDNDGDLDLLLTGQGASNRIAQVYRNDGNGLFSDIGVPITGVSESAASWMDYDNDGRLDLLVAGFNGTTRTTSLYHNVNNSFQSVNTTLAGVANAAIAWGDYDNDGDLDLLLAGFNGSSRVTNLYRNEGGGAFTAISTSFPGVANAAADWGDYDKDGDLDLALAGTADGTNGLTQIYRNDGNNAFVNISAALTGAHRGSLAWGDYDKDGDLDLLLTGTTNGATRLTHLYRNDGGGVFTNVNAALTAVDRSSAVWGDYDNDGDLDILLAGDTGSTKIAQLYTNNGGVFSPFAINLTGVSAATAAWGDYDNDADVDVLLTGDAASGRTTKLYRNTNCISDLKITKTVKPVDAAPGETITYTLAFTNSGPQPGVGVKINDLFPADLTPLLSSNKPVGAGVKITETHAANNYSWQVSNLAINQGGIITVTAQVLAGAPASSITNTATITAIHDITLTNNTGVAFVYRPFHITQTVPMSPTVVGTGLAGVVRATFDADLNAASANQQNFVVRSNLQGVRTGLFGYDGINRRLNFTATQPFRQGEVVQVVGTRNLRSLSTAVLQPYQWQFIAGLADVRCVAGFIGSPVTITNLKSSAAAWGDYDNDGDVDLVQIGSPDGATRVAQIQRNDGNGVFTNINANLTGVIDGAVAWGDYDNDGDLDLLLAGASAGGPIAHLYRNDGNNNFSNLSAPLTGVTNAAAAWGDYDNDGDLDLLLIGTNDGTNGMARIYRNDSGLFTNLNAPLTGVHRGGAAWGDIDSDGDLDLLISGTTNGAVHVTQLYRNNGKGGFANMNIALQGLDRSSAALGDYDRDGDLDLLLSGTADGSNGVTRVIRNNGNNNFTDIGAALVGVYQGAATWGDFTNDGLLDILLTGQNSGGRVAKVYENKGNGLFSEFLAPLLTGVSAGSAAWGDYNGDAGLDILLTGDTGSAASSKVYFNDDCTSNVGMIKSVTPATALPGQPVTYTLSFDNVGPQAATRVLITDLLPSGLTDPTFAATLPLTSTGTSNYNWRAPNLAVGQAGSIQINGRVALAAAGTVFTNTATIRAKEDITPTNDTGAAALTVLAPRVSFNTASYTVDEAGGQVTIMVVLDAPNPYGSVTVTYETASDTALENLDFPDVQSIVTIPAGQTSAAFNVAISEDALDEDNESLRLVLSNPLGGLLGATSTASIIINDNDLEPSVTIGDASVDESAGVVTLNVTLSAVSGRNVTVNATTADDTAKTPGDYTALTNQQVLIPAGAVSVPLAVSVANDAAYEADERFFVNLSSPVNVTIADGQAIVTILANDTQSDQDFDTIPNQTECPNLAACANNDADNKPNVSDIDSDGDGIPDLKEASATLVDLLRNEDYVENAAPVDTDSDGTPDYLDTDSDNDSLLDAVEGHDADCNGSADRTAKGTDNDDDGLDDNYDTMTATAFDVANAGASNAALQDCDVDSIRNWRDPDDDGDGIPTLTEIGPDPLHPLDNNGNGIPDYLEGKSGSRIYFPVIRR